MTRAVLVGLLVLGLTLLAIELAYVLLLAFAGVVVATVLRHGAGALSRRTPLSLPVAMLSIIAGLAGLSAGFFMLAGPEIASELAALAEELPRTWAAIRVDILEQTWGQTLIDRVSEGVRRQQWNIFGTVTGAVSVVFGLLANILIIVSIAAFLTLNPALYREGLIRLAPPRNRDRLREVFGEIGQTLSWWLVGQLVAMAVVAILMTVGLSVIGVPLAIALGVIAGVTNIIPYLGPYLGGAPAVLIAFANDPRAAIWTVILIVVVQQLEGTVITPLVQQRAATLPAALIIVSVIAFGVLFGLLGVLLATPLLIVVLTAVRMLYVEGHLERSLRSDYGPSRQAF